MWYIGTYPGVGVCVVHYSMHTMRSGYCQKGTVSCEGDTYIFNWKENTYASLSNSGPISMVHLNIDVTGIGNACAAPYSTRQQKVDNICCFHNNNSNTMKQLMSLKF